MEDYQLKTVKANAIIEFVETMIGAYTSNFVESNWLSLGTLHAVARNTAKDQYGVEVPTLAQNYGEELAKSLHAQHELQAEIQRLRERLEGVTSEVSVVRRMVSMCEQSLSPHYYGQFVNIIEQLRCARRALAGMTLHPKEDA